MDLLKLQVTCAEEKAEALKAEKQSMEQEMLELR